MPNLFMSSTVAMPNLSMLMPASATSSLLVTGELVPISSSLQAKDICSPGSLSQDVLLLTTEAVSREHLCHWMVENPPLQNTNPLQGEQEHNSPISTSK
ncbi:hypothetical protein AMECASPLE_004611 [Ameca splendens]|uniref:Uncharacterized protein n=1 Tax=Ameca splendens TaxID=208324 RepID=A0ABV0YX37_9TELE